MTEKVRELLSVLMDGEASEIEVHRLLRQMGDDDSLNEVWVAYQETRRVIRRPSKNATESAFQLSASQHLALHRRINAAIDEDTAFSQHHPDVSTSRTNYSGKPGSHTEPVAAFISPLVAAVSDDPAAASVAVEPAAALHLVRPAAAFAIAASLVVAVLVAVQVNLPESDTDANGPSVVQSDPPEVRALSGEIPVSLEIASEPLGENLDLKELDAEGQRRLRAYLNQHDRMSRMRPDAQLVTYPAPQTQ